MPSGPPDRPGGADPERSRPGAPVEGPDDQLLEVGRIVKPHGLRGEVIVALSTNRDERLAPGSQLRTGGARVLCVEQATPHRGRFIVRFEGVAGIDGAEALRDETLFAPPMDDPDVLWIHELIGAAVEDVDGRALGTVEAVEANPASDLLVLENGVLIPLRFVVHCDPRSRITVDVPEGLVEPG